MIFRGFSGGGGGVLVDGRGPTGLVSTTGIRVPWVPSEGQGQGFGGGASGRNTDGGFGVQGVVLLEIEDS